MVALLGARRAVLGGPRVVARDSYGRADSAVTLGNAETSQAYTVGNSTDLATLPTFGVSGSLAYSPNTGTVADPHIWLDCGVPDVVIDCRLTVEAAAAGSVSAGLVFRRLSTGNYFAVRLDNSANTIDVLRNLATSRTVLVSTALPLVDGQVVILRVIAQGTGICVYADGALKLSLTDPNFTTATKHGLLAPFTVVGGAARWDDYRVQAA